MKFKKIKPNLGDVIAISDQMSLRFEKVANDISPVWLEIPFEPGNIKPEDGSYLVVTDELWFVYEKENHSWRIMKMSEHQEAYRQSWFNDLAGQ